MTRVERYKKGLSAFISSEKGQRFFNFAYSIGAAIVIWGALFKILHLPGGNMLLSLGMGTEVLMFVLTAFDRPPKEYKWEEVFPVLNTHKEEDRPNMQGGGGGVVGGVIGGVIGGTTEGATGGAVSGGGVSGGTVIIGGSTPMDPQAITDVASANQSYTEQMKAIAEELQHLHESTAALNKVSETLLESYQAITNNSSEISASSNGYVDQMQALNHNIQGLNTIYEIQLRSVSSQIDAIDRVNKGIKEIRDMFERSAQQSTRYCEETEKMALYMQQLNSVYERMIHALSIQMNPMAAAAAAAAPAPAPAPTPAPAEPAEAPAAE